MHKDNHLIFEALQKKWKLTSMAAADAEKQFGKEHVKVTAHALRNGKDMVEVHVPVDDKGHDVAEDEVSLGVHGAINDITDVQKVCIDALKDHGFHVNKVSNAHAEQQGGPVVYMGKRTGAMHQVAEIDPQGMINDEMLEDYLKNHVHDEDAEEGASKPFQYNAMTHLTQAANHIRHILKDNADDEAQVEHIIRMAQIILGDKADYSESEYRKMLDGLIVILNRFIIVPMN
jgi:hypothetical protein